LWETVEKSEKKGQVGIKVRRQAVRQSGSQAVRKSGSQEVRKSKTEKSVKQENLQVRREEERWMLDCVLGRGGYMLYLCERIGATQFS
jgi:hypothetical protein